MTIARPSKPSSAVRRAAEVGAEDGTGATGISFDFDSVAFCTGSRSGASLRFGMGLPILVVYPCTANGASLDFTRSVQKYSCCDLFRGTLAALHAALM